MKVKVKLRHTQRHGGRKSYNYTTLTTDFEGDWKSGADHQRFRQQIRAKYSGASIVMYTPAR